MISELGTSTNSEFASAVEDLNQKTLERQRIMKSEIDDKFEEEEIKIAESKEAEERIFKLIKR